MPEKLKVYFLGTGGSTPFSNRKYPCIVVRYLNYLILFDVGEGCQFSLINSKIHPLRHDTIILITHYHADHTSGLVGLLHTYNLMGMAHNVTIIGPTGLHIFMSHLMSAFLIDDFYFPLKIVEVDPRGIINESISVFDAEKFCIEAYPTRHSAISLGYAFIEKPFYKLDPIKLEKLKVPYHLRKNLSKGEVIRLGANIIKPEDVSKAFYPGKKIVYTGDTLPTERTVNVARNADLLIHDSTFLDEKLSIERFHSSLSGAVYVAEKAGVKKLALVHISGRYDLEEVKKEISNIKTSIEILLPSDGFTLVL